MIRSTFYGFTTALSGLRVSQNAMDVIGQNVSNANTEGYTRQRVEQASVHLNSSAERYGYAKNPLTGQGATVNSIAQIRDTTLDVKFRTENASVGRYSAELGAMSDVQKIFDEAIKSGLRDSILKFEEAFQEYSKNSSHDEFDAITRGNASSMAKLLNQYANQLENAYKQELYDFQEGSVADLNDILKSLAIIDDTIMNSEVGGSKPLELYDQRNTLLDRLSSYGDIDYYYEKKTLAPDIITNVLHVSMKTASGTSIRLVDGDKFAQFGVQLDEGDTDSIRDNKVSLFVSDLTDNTALTYDDIVEQMAEKGKTPVDLTPVYGEAAQDPKQFNKTAVTNGILFGSLNMLNAAGNYEQGGSAVRGYKYYMGALDTLAKELATQVNTQNQSINYFEYEDPKNPDVTLHDVLYAVYDEQGNQLVDANGNRIYARITKNDDGTENIAYGTVSKSDPDYRNYDKWTPVANIAPDPNATTTGAVTDADGKVINTLNVTITAADGTISNIEATFSDKQNNDLFTSDDGKTTSIKAYTVDANGDKSKVDSAYRLIGSDGVPVTTPELDAKGNPTGKDLPVYVMKSEGDVPVYDEFGKPVMDPPGSNNPAMEKGIIYTYGTISKTNETDTSYKFEAIKGADGTDLRTTSSEKDPAVYDNMDDNDPRKAILHKYSKDTKLDSGEVTAQNICVSEKWLQKEIQVVNTNKFTKNSDNNAGANDNISAFINMFQKKTDFISDSGLTIYTGGFEDYLSSIGGQANLDVSTHTTTYESYNTVLSSIDMDRMSVSGVNIDEEAVTIYQFQRAYEACSRVMTALDELLDKLINSTGVVGR